MNIDNEDHSAVLRTEEAAERLADSKFPLIHSVQFSAHTIKVAAIMAPQWSMIKSIRLAKGIKFGHTGSTVEEGIYILQF